MAFYERRAVVEAVRWTGDKACAAGTGIAGKLAGLADQPNGSLIFPTAAGRSSICLVDEWLVLENDTLRAMTHEAFEATFTPAD